MIKLNLRYQKYCVCSVNINVLKIRPPLMKLLGLFVFSFFQLFPCCLLHGFCFLIFDYSPLSLYEILFCFVSVSLTFLLFLFYIRKSWGGYNPYWYFLFSLLVSLLPSHIKNSYRKGDFHGFQNRMFINIENNENLYYPERCIVGHSLIAVKNVCNCDNREGPETKG